MNQKRFHHQPSLQIDLKIEEASKSYNEIISSPDSLGIIIDFKSDDINDNKIKKQSPELTLKVQILNQIIGLTAGLIGSGEYARRVFDSQP